MKTDPLAKVVRYTEHTMHRIDAHGDSIDCDAFDRKADALSAVEAIRIPDGETVAVCVERVKRSGSETEGVLTSDEETVAWRGDESALRAGGWIP